MNAFPTRKPNRRKRLALRLTVFVVALSALGAAYWFTRPPELVWWRSPIVGSAGLRAKALIPIGWEPDLPWVLAEEYNNGAFAEFSMHPVDRRPKYLRWLLLAHTEESAFVSVSIHQASGPKDGYESTDAVVSGTKPNPSAYRYIKRLDERAYASIHYERENLPAFNGTYRQICNSLTIE